MKMTALLLLMLAASANAMTVDNLRCEYRHDPFGIDETKPRLSWIVQADERGARQTAYQVVVTSPQGELWDSGKVASDETTAIVYAGKPLTSGLHCSWKVKVWDQNDKASDWSKPASWAMGLLDKADWKSDWIGCDKLRQVEMPEPRFEPAKWIGHAADQFPNAPKGFRLYLNTLTLPENVKIKRAELFVTADDICEFVINGQIVARIAHWEVPASVDVTSDIKPGTNNLRVRVENTSDGPTGLLAKLVVTTSDGKTVTRVTDASWRSAGDPVADWQTRDIDANACPAVRVLGEFGMPPWGGNLRLVELVLPPPVYLRTSFKADKRVVRATVYATGLGLFDLHLNGRRITDDYFNPGWTDYPKRVHYRAYDVTTLVQQGDNAFGAIVADGWYSGYVGFGGQRNNYGHKPRVRAQLNLEYADGSSAVIGTGANWKASIGAIREADFLMGETCDARQELRGWDTSKFDDSRWDIVDVGAEVQPSVEAHPGPRSWRSKSLPRRRLPSLSRACTCLISAKTSPAWRD